MKVLTLDSSCSWWLRFATPLESIPVSSFEVCWSCSISRSISRIQMETKRFLFSSRLSSSQKRMRCFQISLINLSSFCKKSKNPFGLLVRRFFLFTVSGWSSSTSVASESSPLLLLFFFLEGTSPVRIVLRETLTSLLTPSTSLNSLAKREQMVPRWSREASLRLSWAFAGPAPPAPFTFAAEVMLVMSILTKTWVRSWAAGQFGLCRVIIRSFTSPSKRTLKSPSEEGMGCPLTAIPQHLLKKLDIKVKATFRAASYCSLRVFARDLIFLSFDSSSSSSFFVFFINRLWISSWRRAENMEMEADPSSPSTL